VLRIGTFTLLGACGATIPALVRAADTKADESAPSLQRQLNLVDTESADHQRQRRAWQGLSSEIDDTIRGLASMEPPPSLSRQLADFGTRAAAFSAERDASRKRALAREMANSLMEIQNMFYRVLSAVSFPGQQAGTPEGMEARRRIENAIGAQMRQLVDNEPVFVTFNRIRTLPGQDVDPAVFSADWLANFQQTITEGAWKKLKDGVQKILATGKATIDGRIAELTKQIDELTRKSNDLTERLAAKQQGQVGIDRLLVTVALPMFGILMLLMLVIPRLYGAADLQRSIITSGILLELITVFLLTSTILMLGIGGRIEPAVLGTLLGGISGYVLGRSALGRTRPTTEPTVTDSTPEGAR
jgi:hypothetical protein